MGKHTKKPVDDAEKKPAAVSQKKRVVKKPAAKKPPTAKEDAAKTPVAKGRVTKKPAVKKDAVKKAAVKKLKDPNAPKRPLNAYMFFAQAKRAEVKEENSELNACAVVTRLGEMWKSMSEAEKKPYTDLSAKDKERYEEEIRVYTPPVLVTDQE